MPRIYAADNALASLPPIDRARARHATVVPLVDALFEWVARAARTTPGRTLATKALGYSVNRSRSSVASSSTASADNTRSERALRKIVVGRKNWLFYGSDLHAEAAAAIFSVIASCRLHRLDPWTYLDEVLRVLPYWPKERHFELAPKYWPATRARLNAASWTRPSASSPSHPPRP